jgi:AAA domain
MDISLEPAGDARRAPGTPLTRDTGALRLPARALLVVAGVPGAGKTTLLARTDTSGSAVLDPEAVRSRWRPALGRLPYRLWRPLVHARHYLGVLAALRGPAGLVVHQPGTRAWMRRLLVASARRAGRQAHLLLLEVSLQDALTGQRRRRRALRRAAFDRHWRRWRRLRHRRDRLEEEGWTSVRVLDRAAAERLHRIEIPRAVSGVGRRSPGRR